MRTFFQFSFGGVHERDAMQTAEARSREDEKMNEECITMTVPLQFIKLTYFIGREPRRPVP